MGPGPKDERVPRTQEVLDRTARSVCLIEPTREVEYRRIHLGIALLEPGPIPPLVSRRMSHPLVVPGSDAFELGQLEQGTVAASRGSAFLPGTGGFFIGPGTWYAEAAPQVGRDVVPGPIEPGSIPHASLIPKALRPGVRHRGYHGFERRRLLHCGEPLDGSRVRKAVCADH